MGGEIKKGGFVFFVTCKLCTMECSGGEILNLFMTLFLALKQREVKREMPECK